jgi:hypothetical protein
LSRARPPTRALTLAAALAAGCAARDVVASATAGPAGGTPAGYCAGSGPPILVGDGITVGDVDGTPDDVCTGTVAVRTFVHALCTCEGYATSTRLTTDSFDSAAGPYVPGGTAAPVGLDGELQTNDQVDVGGDLTVAGAAGASLGADLHVARALAVGGPLGTGVAVTAGADARIAGDVDLASLDVAGTLTVPAAATLGGAVTAGQTVRAPVTVDPPCACAPSDLVDIPAFVSAHRTDNQDALIGLAPDRLTGYSGDVSLDLPCGIYYLGPVSGDGALDLRITGRVALLVDGDVSLQAPFTVELATDDAELDLMIGGTFGSTDTITMGRADHPARARVYIGGSDTIDLSGDSQVAANLYAPMAPLAVSGGATVYGSLFVRRLDQAAPVTIHYDVDVLRADVACPP